MSEYQQTPEEIEQGIMRALVAQSADVFASASAQEMVARHFSVRVPPMIRHVPQEIAHLPSGWVTGANGIRSYYDLCRMYWRWSFYADSGVSVDPVLRKVSFVIHALWEWRDPSRGPPWNEVATCAQTYDCDFKVTIAEFVTISGENTNCFFIGRNLRPFNAPIAGCGNSKVRILVISMKCFLTRII
jgi:hypothetical protein